MKNKLLEEEIIGIMIFNKEAIPKIFRVLSIADFKNYQMEAETVLEAWQQERPIEQELLAKGFRVSSFVKDFVTHNPEAACKSLKLFNTADNLRTLFTEAKERVPEKDIEGFAAEVQQKIIQTISGSKLENAEIEIIAKEFQEYQEVFKEKYRNGGKLLGLETGFDKLDEVIDGLRPGHLWVIGGYTNLGKTYASLNILVNLILKGHRGVFYSLEMSRVDILGRILGIMTEQNGNSIAKGFGDQAKVAKSLALVEKTKLSIYSTKSEMNQILLSMYEESLKDKPAVFIIDFLQLITLKNSRSEYETITQVILELQTTAKRLNIPIIVLSQVSNESAKNGDQTVMGFKGSGAIAAAADLAIELVSGEDNVGELRRKMKEDEPVNIKWHVKKNRHGRVGTLDMTFIGKHGIFKEYEF
jgi:replicative DNA helicase